jgi:hypothetical protein
MEIASPFDNFTYVLDQDKNKEPDKQRKLIGRYLSVREQAIIQDIESEIGFEGRKLNTGSCNLMAVHFGLEKMIGFTDRNGKQIELKREEEGSKLLNGKYPLNEIALEYIPPLDFMRFAVKIRNGGNLDEAESKN